MTIQFVTVFFLRGLDHEEHLCLFVSYILGFKKPGTLDQFPGLISLDVDFNTNKSDLEFGEVSGKLFQSL